jgi:alpha/beta superfamily hydrolase
MQKAVEIKSGDQILRGALHIPDGENKKTPIVIIYHGFCGNKMGPHFMFVKLCRNLEALGIASIRFDFSGSGESDGEFIDMTLGTEIAEANNILDYVENLKFVDKSKIGILGFSMGGAIASVIAGDRKDEINTLCLWSPAGNMDKIILSDTYVGDKLDDFLKNGNFDVEGLLLGKNFIEDIKDIKIYDRAACYEKESIIIHGNQDEVVPLAASKKYLEIYGEKSKLNIIDGANHIYEKNSWEREVIVITKNYFVNVFNENINKTTVDII